MHPDIISIVRSALFETAIKRVKKKDKELFKQAHNQILKIIREPNIGKPLRYSLKNRRRLHVGSFVIVYEFLGGELRFIDFDHHDKIYKKKFWDF